jgi:hypothetical protein
MKKEYTEIEVPSDGKPNWGDGARCMFFVYSKYKGNFILKGYLREVEKFLKENYTHYFYYNSMWHNGVSRGHWKFWKDGVTIWEPNNSKRYKRVKYIVIKYKVDGYERKKVSELAFKRLPKRWIPEFDRL